MKKKVLGSHILAEYKGCDIDVINSVSVVEKSLLDAAKVASANVVASSFHRFEPCGVSGVVIISESHLAIHTWPEYLYAAVDIFTCGDNVYPDRAYEYLKMVFKSKEAVFKVLDRGVLD